MQFAKAIIKIFLAAAIALNLAPASAQFSRWAPVMHVEGASDGPVLASPDGSMLVLMRYQMDALRSVDAGLTWAPFSMNGQRPLRTSYAVQFAPTKPTTWYAIGEDSALYLSTDAGVSWSKRGDQSATGYAGGYVALSADPQVIYQGRYVKPDCGFNEGCPITQSTIQVSTDGGIHWRDIRSEASLVNIIPSPVDAALVFYTGPEGLSRSRDGGVTWTVIVPRGSSDPPNGSFAFDRFDASIVYALPTGGSAEFHGFVSRDAGTTWTSVPLPEGGQVIADPVQSGRAFTFHYSQGTYETRDAGRSWVHVEPGNSTSINSPVGGVVMRDGKRFAINVWDSNLRELDLNNGALALSSDTWWNPDQSGWGLSITHHSSTQTFAAWFAYDRNGDPVWRVVPGGQWTDRVFKGDIYETTGPPFFGVAFDPSKVVARKVGKAQIAFDDEDNAVFSWQLDEGLSANQRVIREKFAAPNWPQGIDDNFADLWWNSAQSGWGIAINHQYDTIFAAWYTYDAAGHPLWIVMPNAKLHLDGVGAAAVPKATGDIYTTHGPPSTVSFDPSQVVATQVGTATLTFPASGQAQLDYTAFGHTESRAITRQPF